VSWSLTACQVIKAVNGRHGRAFIQNLGVKSRVEYEESNFSTVEDL
jgi:hypothetical protein